MDKKDFKKDLGALWKKESKSGLVYYSGIITLQQDYKAGDKINISVFANNYKKDNAKAPDFTIKESSQPKQENSTSNSSGEEQPSDDEIPF